MAKLPMKYLFYPIARTYISSDKINKKREKENF